MTMLHIYKSLILTVALLFTSTVFAAPADDALAAYNSEDFAEAARIATPLANDGNPWAQHVLGLLHIYGRAVDQDSEKGLKLLHASATQNYGPAQQLLASLSFSSKNYAIAEQWYRKSAEQGYARSQAMLGFMYYTGYDGVAQDQAHAMKWLNLAAEQNDPDAIEILALIKKSKQ